MIVWPIFDTIISIDTVNSTHSASQCSGNACRCILCIRIATKIPHHQFVVSKRSNIWNATREIFTVIDEMNLNFSTIFQRINCPLIRCTKWKLTNQSFCIIRSSNVDVDEIRNQKVCNLRLLFNLRELFFFSIPKNSIDIDFDTRCKCKNFQFPEVK